MSNNPAGIRTDAVFQLGSRVFLLRQCEIQCDAREISLHAALFCPVPFHATMTNAARLIPENRFPDRLPHLLFIGKASTGGCDAVVHSHKMKSYPPLHWLRGWAERIDGLIGLEKPSHYDWMLFRPDSEAVDEMLALGARFAYQMGRIDEYLNHANECYRELLELLPPHSCPHCGESSYLEIQGTILLCDWCGERKELSQVPAHKLENASASFRDALHCLKRVILTTADVVLKAEQTADTSGAQSAIDSLSEKIRLADEMRREAGIDSSKAQELAAGAFLAAQPVKTNPWRDDITRKWNEHDKRQEREAAKRQARSIKMLMEELEAEGIETAGISGEKSMTTNERMLAMLNADKSRTEWSAQKWADELGVSKSAIQKTKAWEMIMRSREAAKQRQAENAVPTWEQ